MSETLGKVLKILDKSVQTAIVVNSVADRTEKRRQEKAAASTKPAATGLAGVLSRATQRATAAAEIAVESNVAGTTADKAKTTVIKARSRLSSKIKDLAAK